MNNTLHVSGETIFLYRNIYIAEKNNIGMSFFSNIMQSKSI